MALTWTINEAKRANLGINWVATEATAQPAVADYVTGGYTVTPSQIGLDGTNPLIISGLYQIGFTGTIGGYDWQWNKGTGKLQVFGGASGSGAELAEVAAGTDLSGGTATFICNGF